MQVDTMFFLLSGQTTQSLLEPALLHAVPGAPAGQVNLFLGRSESSLCQAGTVTSQLTRIFMSSFTWKHQVSASLHLEFFDFIQRRWTRPTC